MAFDAVFAPQRCDQSSRPVVASSSTQFRTVEYAGDHLVAIDSRQCANGLYNILGRLTTFTTRQTQWRMNTTFPVDKQNELARLFIDIYDDLPNQSSQQAFLRALIRLRRSPQRLKVTSKIQKLFRRAGVDKFVLSVFCGNPRFERMYRLQCNIPPALQFLRNETILRVSRLILPLSPLCAVSRGFKIATQGGQHLRTCLGLLLSCQDRCLYRRWLNNP